MSFIAHTAWALVRKTFYMETGWENWFRQDKALLVVGLVSSSQMPISLKGERIASKIHFFSGEI